MPASRKSTRSQVYRVKLDTCANNDLRRRHYSHARNGVTISGQVSQRLSVSLHHQAQIERWLAALGTPQQVALRGRIVLAAGSGKSEVEALDISFKEESGGYLHTNALQGAKELALWPLSQASES